MKKNSLEFDPSKIVHIGTMTFPEDINTMFNKQIEIAESQLKKRKSEKVTFVQKKQ